MRLKNLQSLQSRNHRSILCGMLVGISLGLTSPLTLAQSTQSEMIAVTSQESQVVAAAQRELAQFVQHQMNAHAGATPAGFPLDVSHVQDLKDARVAYVFPVYTVAPEELLAGRADLQSMAKPNGQWRAVIGLNGRPVGMATLEQNNGQWETLSYGAAVLARDIDVTMARHANASHSNVRFIRIYQAKSDLLEVVSANDRYARYVPLHSARVTLSLQARALNSADAAQGAADLTEGAELLQSLRPLVKANMDAFR